MTQHRTYPVREAAVVIAFAALICFWFVHYLTSEIVAAVDLPGHIAAIELLAEQLYRGNIRFYDPNWFTGWPAFQFYAFAAHLLAALLSYPLALISPEPARLAAHLQLLFLLATLPLAVRYFLQPVLEDLFRDNPEHLSKLGWQILALTCAFTFWFINHDGQWFGIGAAGVLNVGLFSQALGWHLMLLALGALLRVVSRPKATYRLAGVFFGLLLLTHTLTAIYSLFIALLLFCFYPARRTTVAAALALGFGISAFWFLPLLYYSSSYLGQDIHRPSGDFLELFFRYPLHALIKSFRSDPLKTFLGLDLNNLIMLGCAAGAFLARRLIASKLFFVVLGSILLSVLVFSSGFVASSITQGLHYYRFLSYAFLLTTAVLCVVPFSLLADPQPKRRALTLRYSLRVWIILGLTFTSFASSIGFPHYERSKVREHIGQAHLSDEDQVLQALAADPVAGRVLFEYFSDYSRFPFLSAHYKESVLKKVTGRESINGLYIQSSTAYRMPIASAKLLGIPGYHLQLLFVDRAKYTPQSLGAQLRRVGITHLVISQRSLTPNVRALAVKEPRQIGRYYLVQIAEAVPPKVAPVERRVIAYLDQQKTLPFAFLQFYLYAREQLDTRFELIEVKPGDSLPPQTAGVLVNGDSSRISELLKFAPGGTPQPFPPVISFDYDNSYELKHYAVWYQHSVELDAYNAAEQFLENKLRLAEKLYPLQSRTAAINNPTTPAPTHTWASGNQRLKLAGLVPGQLYRIDYSYFPYWSVDQGQLWRGSGERIFLLADSTSAELKFSTLNSPICLLSYLITGLSLLFVVRRRRTSGRN